MGAWNDTIQLIVATRSVGEIVPESLFMTWEEYNQAIQTIIELMNHAVNDA